jgi:PKD repeat protein
LDNNYLFILNEQTIYKMDLKSLDIIDSVSFDFEIKDFGLHNENILFISDNTLYYYDDDKERITKEMSFDFNFYNTFIASTDSTIIMSVTDYKMINLRPHYYYYLVHLRIEDMEEYFNSDFYAERDSVLYGDEVQFRSYALTPEWNYFWDFGDGKTSNAQNPQHNYSEPGYYSVTLIVSDEERADTTFKKDYIYVRPLISSLFYSETEYCRKNEPVQFRDTSIGDNLNYFWKFGDGNMSNKREPIHYYSETGEFDVELVVRNENYSDTLLRNNYIKVRPEIRADFSFSRTVTNNETIVNAQDNSEGIILNRKWLTFRGDTLFDTNPEIVYSKPGIYHLKLIVDDGYYTDSTINYFVAYEPLEDIWFNYSSINTYQNKSSFDSIITDYLRNDRLIAYEQDSISIMNTKDFEITDKKLKNNSSLPFIIQNQLYSVEKNQSEILIQLGDESKKIQMPNDDYELYKVIYTIESNKLYIFTHNIHTSLIIYDLYSESTKKILIAENGLIDDILLQDDNILINALDWQEVSGYDYKYRYINLLNEYDLEGNLIENINYNFSEADSTIDFKHYKNITLLDTGLAISKDNNNYATIIRWDKYSETGNPEIIDSVFKFKMLNIVNTKIPDNNRILILGENEGKAAIEIFNIDSLKSKLITLNIEGKLTDAIINGNFVNLYGLYKQNSEQYTFFELTTTLDLLTNIDNTDIAYKTGFEIAPNPASDYIEISFGSNSVNKGLQHLVHGDDIEIYDVLGEVVWNSNPSLRLLSGAEVRNDGYFDYAQCPLRIDISHLTKGVYFVRLGNNFEKFVKM